jgi:hypothetical protein
MHWAVSVAITAVWVNPVPHNGVSKPLQNSGFQHFNSVAARKPRAPNDKTISPQPNVCPSSLPVLTAWMLQDLPSYANRVRQRSWSSEQRHSNRDFVLGTIIVAGHPELEPLPTQVLGDTSAKFSPELQQVFFTTLERDYPFRRFEPPIHSHSYHWLFLTQTKRGWEFVQMITRIGKTTSPQTALPPRDSSDGAIAQGIRQWLRDCQAGSLSSTPPQPTASPPRSPQQREAP